MKKHYIPLRIFLLFSLIFVSYKMRAQQMLLLCSSPLYTYEHLSAYPERISIKEFKQGEVENENGITQWAKLLIYDSQLKCYWKYDFYDNECNLITVTVNTKTELEDWIIALDKDYYRSKSNGTIYWYQRGVSMFNTITATIMWEDNCVVFMKLNCQKN